MNEILAKGGLPTLSAGEVAALTVEFGAIGKQIGTRDAIALDVPLKSGRLGVWITSPTAELRDLTGADYGNAVYDANLDAVFIDHSLISQDDLLAVYSHTSYSAIASFNGAPYLRTFLHFIFAHELAHREHHRVSAGAFDGGRLWHWLPWYHALTRDRELEADRYAFATLMHLYAHEKSEWVTLFPLRSAPIYDIHVEDLAGSKQAAALELASAFLMATTAQFFTATPYGAYHEDTAHPNIFSRVSLLLSNLRSTLSSGEPGAGLEGLSEVVQRLARQPEVPMAEVLAPWPIGMASGTGSRLLLMGADNHELLEIPWATLQARAHRHESVTLRAHRTARFLVAPAPRDLASPEGFLYSLSEAGQRSSMAQGFPLPQPGSYVASQPSLSDEFVELTVTDARGPRHCASPLAGRSWPKRTGPDLGRSLATPIAVYSELIWPDAGKNDPKAGSRRSWLRIDPQTCHAQVITYFAPADVQRRWNEGLWSFVAIHGVEQPVWAGPLSARRNATGWGVWRLSESAVAGPVLQVPSPYQAKPGIPAWERRFFESKLAEVGPLSADGMFINVGNEGIYAVSFHDKGAELRLLWPVGDEVFTVISLTNGGVIFFLKGGRKCYVAFPPTEAA